jgi:hypothetical protein
MWEQYQQEHGFVHAYIHMISACLTLFGSDSRQIAAPAAGYLARLLLLGIFFGFACTGYVLPWQVPSSKSSPEDQVKPICQDDRNQRC